MNIICAITILLTYTVVMCIKGGGIPSSLSASVFLLPYGKRWIWTVTLFSVCILVLYPFGLPHSASILDFVSENTRFLAFISIAALAFVGAAPLVKDKQDIAYKVHCDAAAVCAVASQMLLIANMPVLLPVWPFYMITLLAKTNQNGTWNTKVFWGEQVCFFTTFAFCLISIYYE